MGISRKSTTCLRQVALVSVGAGLLWAGGSMVAPSTAKATETRIIISTPGLEIRIGDRGRRFDRKAFRHWDRRSFKRFKSFERKKRWKRFRKDDRRRGFDRRWDRNDRRSRRFHRKGREWRRGHSRAGYGRREFRSHRYKRYRFRR